MILGIAWAWGGWRFGFFDTMRHYEASSPGSLARAAGARVRADARPCAVSALPPGGTVPRRPRGGRDGRSLRAQRLLFRRRGRRGVEDHRRRGRVAADFRRAAQNQLGGRHRRGRFRPQRDLRGDGRILRARQCLERRRSLQVGGWRQDLAECGAPGQPDHRRGAGASQESGHRVRRRAGPSLGAERHARRLPVDRWRRHVETGAHARAGCRRGGSGHGPRQSAGALRQLLAGAPQPLPFR